VPLLDRVLVQRIKAEAKTASGIFLPESSVKELNEAKVLAVGPGALDKEGKRLPIGVQAGDRVLIPTVRSYPTNGLDYSLSFSFGVLFAVRLTGWCLVWRLPCQGWRGGVHSLPGQRVSFLLFAIRCCKLGNADLHV
jgi:co-chaperonin GroES (HSP10)